MHPDRPHLLRPFLRGAAGLAGLAAILVVAALLPPVQRALLRRALVRAGATDMRIDSFQATPFGLAAGRIAFVRGGYGMEGEGVVLRLHPLALLRHHLTITQAKARSLVVRVDLAAAPELASGPAAAPAQPANSPVGSAEAASETLSSWRAPLFLRIDGVELPGHLEIRRGPTLLESADWTLSGGGLRPGQEGVFACRVSARGPGMPPDKPASFAGQVSLAEDASAGISHLSFTGQAEGIANPLAPSLGLRLDFSRPGPGAAYRLKLGLGVGAAQLSAELASAGGAAAAIDGEIHLAHVPAAWANRWLQRAQVSVAAGQFNFGWKLHAAGGSATLSALALPADRLQLVRSDGRALPPLLIEARPSGQIGPGGLRLDLDRLHVEGPQGWAADLSLAAETGLPPIAAAQLDRLELRASRGGAPLLVLQLAHPRRIALADPLDGILRQGPPELVTFSARGFPLDWLSRFLPGRALSGTWAAGESVLESVPGKGLALATTTPWRFEQLRFDEGGKTYFEGRVEVSPAGTYGPGGHWLSLRNLAAADARGTRLSGRLAFGLRPDDDQSGGGIDVRADLPHVPGSGGKLGPIRVELAAAAHAVAGGRGEIAHFALTVTDARNALLVSATASQPITIERTPQTEWLVSSAQPLRFRTGRAELARLNPWLADRGLAVSGILPAMELQLWFAPRHLRLVAGTSLEVARFHLERNHEVLVDRALLKFGTSLDLAFEHHLLPKFSVNGTATWGLTDGLLAEGGAPLARFNGQVILGADENGFAPKDVKGGLWADLGGFGRQPFLAQVRLPEQGDLNLQVGKSPTRPHALDFAGRIDHVVGRDGRPAPFLDISGHAGGDWNGRVGTFGLSLMLASQPKRSDLAFGIKLDVQHLRMVNVASRLTGGFVDLDAISQFAEAFSPAAGTKPAAAAPAPRAAPAKAAAPAPAMAEAAPAASAARPAPPPAPDGPPWGAVRGHFTLGIKALRLAPYEIDNLQGRLDLTDDTLALSQCSGSFFGGRWSADSRTVIRPGDLASPAQLTAHFRVERFDAGQAVRLHFPSPAAGFDGRLNLDVTVSSRASRWEDLVSHAAGRFELSAQDGRVRLVLPRQQMISSALILGGTLTFSKEMRALGRLLPQLADMPISELRSTGTLEPDGKLELDHVELATPQLRLVGTGAIPDAKVRDLMGQPFQVQATLAAKGDLAVILGGMHLLGAAGPNGFQAMNQVFRMGGNVGQPDFQPFYDLLARAVDGSSGSWGMLMHKVQAMADAHAPSGR